MLSPSQHYAEADRLLDEAGKEARPSHAQMKTAQAHAHALLANCAPYTHHQAAYPDDKPPF